MAWVEGQDSSAEDMGYSYELLRWQNTMLRQANADLRHLLDVARENLSLRSRLLGFDGKAELSGNKTINASETLDEVKFTDNLTRAPHRTSSPVILKSTTKDAADISALHQEEPAYRSHQSHNAKCLESSAPRCSHKSTHQHEDSVSQPTLYHDLKDLTCIDPERLLGEIAFQLDRRILAYVFQGQSRLYGFTTLNIFDKIIQVSKHPLTGKVDEAYRCALTKRYLELMEDLQFMGYSQTHHPLFTEIIINTFGVLRHRPHSHSAQELGYSNTDFLRKIIIKIAPPKMFKDLLTLFRCLCSMAQNDNKPLFLW